MGTIDLELPGWLERTVRDLAKRDNVSINQFIALALAEKVSALMNEDYLQERAERGNLEKFKRALSKVPDVEPDEGDKL